jgi:hypothetical protein
MAKDLGKTFLENIWGKRASGIPVSRIDWNRPVRPEDVQYLLTRYPFLQIINSDAKFEGAMKVTFVPTKSGWVIHDYGDAMSASPGELLFGSYGKDLSVLEEEGGEGGEGGSGTIVNQAYITAQEMVALAIQKGWAGVEVIAGTTLMQWAAWMAAQDRNFSLIGYEPNKEAQDKRARVKKTLTTKGPEAPEAPARPR